MMLLAINSASKKEEVALIDSKKVIAEEEWHGANDETEKLLKKIYALMHGAKYEISDLDGVLVISGPGPFSSVRIGMTVAHSLGFALGIPVYELPTLLYWRLRSNAKVDTTRPPSVALWARSFVPSEPRRAGRARGGGSKSGFAGLEGATRAPTIDALIFHAGGRYIATAFGKKVVGIFEMAQAIETCKKHFKDSERKRARGGGSNPALPVGGGDASPYNRAKRQFICGDITEEERILWQTQAPKNWEFTKEDDLKSLGETVCGMHAKTLKTLAQRLPMPHYFKPPNITPPKIPFLSSTLC